MTAAASNSAVTAMDDHSTLQAFDREGLLRRASPFLGAMWLAILIYPLVHGGDSRALPAAVLVLNALIVLAAIALPWKRLPQFAQIIPVFAYFVVIALLREADGGGMSGYGALSMLPVFWLALYGTRKQLAVSIAGVAAVFVVPLLVLGEPEYPSSEWTRALLWICVAPIVGFTVQSLVGQLRDERRGESAPRAGAPGQSGGNAQARRQHGRRDRGHAGACPDGRPQGRP